MRIVHVVYSMEMGGAETVVAQLCRIQRGEGHDVTVCAYSKLGALGEQLVAEGFAVHVLGEAHPLKTNARYFQLFRELRPHVVHCHNPAPTLQAAIPARLAGAACVVATRHSLVAPPYDSAAEIKFNLVSRFVDWIAGICEITCVNLRATPLARRDCIVRVYNGALPVPIAERIDTGGRFTVLFVGRLAAIKDLRTLIRAVAEARAAQPLLQLWIVGDGVERAALESLAGELEVQDYVRFWGEQMDTAEFFRSADLFAMSSVSEGLPMSLLQAMSIGLPAVVTAVGGMREVVERSGCGLCVPVGDAARMADAIVRISKDDALRGELGGKARIGYEREFTLQQMNESYMRLYRGARAVRN